MLEKILLPAFFFFFSLPIFSQISAPVAEAVYGGRILDIATCALNASESRVFITTESANSAFYADIDHSSSTPVVGPFQVLPALDASAGIGGQVNMMDVVPATGTFVFQYGGGLSYSHMPYHTHSSISANMVRDLCTIDDLLIYIEAGQLFWGRFDTSGVYHQSTDAPLSLAPSGGRVKLQINPTDQMLYYCDLDNGAVFYSDTPYHSLNAATTFSAASISTAIMGAAQWQAFGIAPDSRFFLGGNNNAGKYIAYSSDLVSWNDHSTATGGIGAANFAFSGNSAAYHVYFASIYNHNKGSGGSWASFGNFGQQTHPNDGPVMVDPLDPSMVFMTSDQGIAVSENNGANMHEINRGVEAIQVKDFDMTGDKTSAWIASKSGIRRVDDYPASPVWTHPIFPNGDGSPYYAAEISLGNPATVYVGNVRVYKSSDNGLNWNQVFSAEQAPYGFASVGYQVKAIEVFNDNDQIVMAGYSGQNSSGGLFVTEDGGASWEQIRIKSTTDGPDVNVNDIEFTIEGSDTIAYVGVDYQTGSGYSIYKLTKTGSGWTVEQDMSASNTSTGSLIVVTIADLEVSSTGDTIFATGTDAGTNHPVAYYKPLNSSGLWTPFTTSGFPAVAGKKGAAIAIGRDTLYCAVDNEIYYYEIGASSWQLGYSYPPGTEINFLYFDDLLAGTGTGLYGHASQGKTTSFRAEPQESNLQIPINIAPNPVSNEFRLSFQLPQSGTMRITVFDNQGRIVNSVFQDRSPAGDYNYTLDSTDWPAGIYRLSLETGSSVSTVSIIKLNMEN